MSSSIVIRGNRRLRRPIARVGRWLTSLDSQPDVADEGDQTTRINDRFTEDPPSAANAINLFAGEWSTLLPVDAVTGPADLIGDPRLVSCVAALGGIDGGRVLELGPLEGAHSLTLRRDLGASSVVAIEANEGAFLRCLVVKELMHLDGVEFRFGDFRPYIDSTDERFDLAVAIGVLYHLDDPVPVLENLARLSDRIVIWSHVYSTDFDIDRLADRFDPPVERWLGDTSYRLHPYRYEAALEWSGFCGGTRPTAAWIERDDLISVVTSLGFEIALRDDQDHPNGPAITLALQR